MIVSAAAWYCCIGPLNRSRKQNADVVVDDTVVEDTDVVVEVAVAVVLETVVEIVVGIVLEIVTAHGVLPENLFIRGLPVLKITLLS